MPPLQVDHRSRSTKPLEILPEHRDFRGLLFSILAIAFVLRFVWAFSAPPQKFDEYAAIAESIASGHGYSWLIAGKLVPTDIRAPIYPLLLSASLAIAKSFAPAIMLQVLISTTTCLLAYILGASLFTSTVGLICAALSAIDLFQLTMVRYLLTETLYIFLILLCHILLLKVLRSEASRLNITLILAISLTIALAILTRPEAPAYFVLTAICVAFLFRAQGWIYAKRMGIGLGIAFLLVLPWILRNYEALGDFEVSNGALVDFNLYRGLAELNGNVRGDYGFDFYLDIRSGKNPISPASVRQAKRQQILSSWKSVLEERPVAVTTERLRNLSRALFYRGEYFFAESRSLKDLWSAGLWRRFEGKLLIDSVLGVLPWALAVWGSSLAGSEGSRREWATLWFFPLSVTLLMVVLWADPRYMLPAHVLLAPLCALSLRYIFTRSRSFLLRSGAPVALYQKPIIR